MFSEDELDRIRSVGKDVVLEFVDRMLAGKFSKGRLLSSGLVVPLFIVEDLGGQVDVVLMGGGFVIRPGKYRATARPGGVMGILQAPAIRATLAGGGFQAGDIFAFERVFDGFFASSVTRWQKL